MENFSDLGKYLRIPRHEIEFKKTETKKAKTENVIIKAIAAKLKASNRNILPVIVEEVSDDRYEVLLNDDVLEAANEAQLDYVWCILADEERKNQILIESKQKFELNLLTADEEAIAQMLEYVIKLYDYKRIDAQNAAKAIVEKRTEKWTNFTELTKLKCGIGPAKLEKLKEYFVIKAVK